MEAEKKAFAEIFPDLKFNNDFVPNEGEEYCYALALSGGGSFGTYETGVVWGLLHYGNPDDYRWDVFTGVSAGSINAGMFSVFPKGQEVEMSEVISYQCTVTTPGDTLANWPGVLPGPVEGLLYHKGLFDESPMTDYLNDWFSDYERIEKKVVISAVDVEQGTYMPFDESVGIDNLGTIIRASASIPFAFEPTHFEGHWYMDGGTVWNVNLKDAVDKCLEIVEDEEHVILDIAITEFINIEELEETGKTWDNFSRKRAIRKYYKTMNDVAEFSRSRPFVNYRHFFKPSESLGGARAELDFRNETTWHFQEVGRADAKAALEAEKQDGEPAPFSFAQVLTAHYNAIMDEMQSLTESFLS